MGISWVEFFAQMDGVGRAAAALLFIMSVISWAVILFRSVDYFLLKKNRGQALSAFWQQSDYQTGVQALRAFAGVSPYVILAESGQEIIGKSEKINGHTLDSDVSVDARLTRIIRYSLSRSTIRLESGLTFLASVASASPFIGLFGTVWGILNALRSIAFSGTMQLDKIAAPLSEALIMTAFGLAVAIPAVLAYNAFVRINRVILVDLDGFAHDLHRYFCAYISQ